MNVLFLSTWFPWPPDNGSKLRVNYLLRALSKRYKINLLSFAFGTTRPDRAAAKSDRNIEVQAIAANPYDRSRRSTLTRFLSPDPIVTRPLKSMMLAVQRALTAQSFAAVIASTEIMATYALRAPRATVKILEEHNSLSRWMWDRYQAQTSAAQRWRCRISWYKARVYETRLFRRFAVCTMVSEQDRAACRDMLPWYHGCVAVVPNGVDCAHNRPGLAPVEVDQLVFSGALAYSANYTAAAYFLQEIFPMISARQPAAKLLITGSTQGVNLAGLPLSPQVQFTGCVDDIRPVIAGSSVCVVPIREGGGTRVKILEAMALGTPVVSTSKGAEGLDVRHGEHLLLADDAAAFANCTLRLMQDTALRQRLSSNARRLVEACYDWDQIGEYFTGLVEDAIERQTFKH
jgi:glycosyltransferase involved in cell wall biosynthesis